MGSRTAGNSSIRVPLLSRQYLLVRGVSSLEIIDHPFGRIFP
jgi:hypothetical protein